MNKSTEKKDKRTRRHNRIRAKIHGTKVRPRLNVFRSNRELYAQVIDDEQGVTLCSIDSRGTDGKNARERARTLGEKLAVLAKEKGVSTVVFDRGGFLFTGSIKEFAEGARKGGLIF